jgi:hypothetical protein
MIGDVYRLVEPTMPGEGDLKSATVEVANPGNDGKQHKANRHLKSSILLALLLAATTVVVTRNIRGYKFGRRQVWPEHFTNDSCQGHGHNLDGGFEWDKVCTFPASNQTTTKRQTVG